MLTSIIIPVRNRWADTRRCLDSIARHTPKPYEVIVVDNGSTDGTPDYIRAQYPYVRLVRNPVNLSFPRACNQGLALATGDQFLLLNNDTLVTPRWLTGLTRCLREAGGAGLVGPVSNYVSGGQRIDVTYGSLEEMEAFADRFNGPDPSRWRQTVRLVGFCLLVTRRVYEAIGGLDEAFSPGNFEDDDFCLRALSAGYRLWIAGDVFIHHGGSATFREDPAQFASLLVRNRRVLRQKHGLRRYRTDPYPHLGAWLPGSPQRVLDVGCALGACGLQLKQAGIPEVWGVTWDPAEARIARNILDRVILIDGDPFEPPADPGQFDAAVVSGGLDDAPDPRALLARTVELLAPGAPVVLQPLNRHHFLAPGIRERLMPGLPPAEEDLDGTPARRFHLDQIADMVGSLRLEDTESCALLWPPPEPLSADVKRLAEDLVPNADSETAYRLLSTWRFLIRGRRSATY